MACRVAVVARQAGSATAFAPVVRALQEEVNVTCLVLGLEYASRAFATAGTVAQTVTSFAEALPYLVVAQPTVLITGTSFNAVGDGEFWHWAREMGIPSIAFVDNWTNYRERFSSTPSRPFDCLPEHIAVVDALMASRLIAAGCPKERVTIIGHPGWDDLIRRRGHRATELRYALAGDSTLILFVSEPLAQFYGDKLGYTEGKALRLLFDALETLGESRNESYTVAVKPHPVEDSAALTHLLGMASSRVRARLVTGDRLDLVSASDLVVGMNSLLLHEAALMGRPVVALQPGRRQPSDLVDHHPGILLATNPAQAITAITQALIGIASLISAPEPVIPQWIGMIQGIGGQGIR